MFIVQVIQDNVLDEIVHIGTDRAAAEQQFIGACAKVISNFLEEYKPDDIAAILDQGYEKFGNGAVILIDTDGFTSDEYIRASLTGAPPFGVDKIQRWIHAGEIDEVDDIDEVIERAASALDEANSWDICGEVLFQAEDGKWYVGTVEFVIGTANPDYLKEALAENKDV